MQLKHSKAVIWFYVLLVALLLHLLLWALRLSHDEVFVIACLGVGDIYRVTSTENKVQTPVILHNEEVLIYHVPILIYKAAGSEKSG